MQFWRLRNPDYDSDYKRSYINGQLEHPFGLPGVRCDVSVGPYFELVIQSESGYAPRAEPLSVCSGCGRATFPDTEARFVMVDSMWKGIDIFFLASTLYIVVTDRVRHALQNLRATNVELEPFG
jgi:hypothetical protein